MQQSASRRFSTNLCVPSVLVGQLALILPREAYAFPSAGQAAMVTEENPLSFFAIGCASGAVVGGLVAGLIGFSRYRLLELELDDVRASAFRAEQAAHRAQTALRHYRTIANKQAAASAGVSERVVPQNPRESEKVRSRAPQASDGLTPLSTQELKLQRTGRSAPIMPNQQVSTTAARHTSQGQMSGASVPGPSCPYQPSAIQAETTSQILAPVATALSQVASRMDTLPARFGSTGRQARLGTDTLEPVTRTDMRRQPRPISIPDTRIHALTHGRVSGKTTGSLRESIGRTMNLPVIERATPRETGPIVAVPLNGDTLGGTFGGSYGGQATYGQQRIQTEGTLNTRRVAEAPTRVFDPEARANIIDERIPRFDESLFPDLTADVGQAAQADPFAQALEAMDQRMPRRVSVPAISVDDATAEHVDRLVREEFENNRKGEPRRYSRSKLRVVDEPSDVDAPTVALGAHFAALSAVKEA